MNQDTFLYTLPQWFIFSSIMITVYGWVEYKKPFRIIGSSIFILLGLFATYVFVSGYFLAAEFLTSEEIMNEELEEEAIGEIPFQIKLIPAYWSFIISGVLSVPAIYFDLKNKKPTRLFIVLAGLISLFGFFIIVGVVRTL